MSDYTYIRPTDPAATEAELTEAMYVQAAPLDLEYTYDAPPVRLVRASEVAELRARLDAATQRAEAAEARALAATQQWVVARTQLESVHDYAIYYMDAWEVFEADSDGQEPLTFDEWLAQQGKSEV